MLVKVIQKDYNLFQQGNIIKDKSEYTPVSRLLYLNNSFRNTNQLKLSLKKDLFYNVSCIK